MRWTPALLFMLVLAPAGRAQTWRDRLIVKLAAGRDPDRVPRQLRSVETGIPELDALLRDVHASEIRPIFPRPPRGRADEEFAEELGLDRWHLVRLPAERDDIDAVVARFRALASLEVVELDTRIRPTVLPDDPDYGPEQWSLKPDRIDAESAWNQKTDSSDVVVCVLDTGCETGHPDIQGNLWVNPGEIPANGIDDEGNGYVDDVHGWNFSLHDDDVEDRWPHGIHVNGIIGAVGDNQLQVAGINWATRLMQAKIFDVGDDAYTSAAEGTVYAADNGARVTNNSWAGGPGPQPYVDAMRYAHRLDLLQVAAAGNYGDDVRRFPAAYDRMMAVSSTDSNDLLSTFSSRGDWIDLAAPGEQIFGLWTNHGTAHESGTSMACPHVAGAGALIRSINPQLRCLEARLLLRYHGDDLGPAGFDDDFGFGRLDVGQAALAAPSLHLSKLSTTAPDTVDIDLDLPGEANLVYVLLASPAGLTPGIALSTFDPGDARIFPLNHDVFIDFVLTVQPNPFAKNFIGTLDAAGHAKASLVIPDARYFKGREFSFAAVTFDPNDLTHVRAISAALTLKIAR